ncbi:MAG: rhamnogalacturonan acetylesterase [Clostridia bacterium]|nr:rhamnogalacturonan acetylesterase [Clostridia bacterium]
MTTIYWAGDSTVKQNTILTYPQTGIGQMFDRYIKRYHVNIENHAENGRSTKQFMDEGRLAVIYDRIHEGDFLFIQFGHNDEKIADPARYTDPDTEFCENLERYVNAARNKKATPVFITPLCRRLYAEKDEVYRHEAWAASMRRMAEKLGVALIDLTRMSEELVASTDMEEVRTQWYMHLPANTYAHFPEGLSDDTHLQPMGAMRFGALIAQGLYELGGEYRALLCDEYEDWRKECK